MSYATSIPTDSETFEFEKKPILGSIAKVSADEESELWGDFPALRPVHHLAWLRHFVALEFELTRLQAGWIPATSHLEWTLNLPQCLFEDLQHIQLLRERLSEFPTGKSAQPISATMARFIQSIGPADHASSFYKTLFHVVKRELVVAYQQYMERCDEILDAPIIYTLRRIIAEKRDQMSRVSRMMEVYPFKAPDADLSLQYTQHVEGCIQALGGLGVTSKGQIEFSASPVKQPAGPGPKKMTPDPTLRVVSYFPEKKEENPVKLTLREIVYHNATEWQVIPPMCHLFFHAQGMPMEFYADFSRHIWDECRHALMGFRRLAELGFSISDFAWPCSLTLPDSIEGYMARLTMIGEACSFERKQGSIIPFLKFGDKRSAMLPLVDCVDEKNHVGYGAKWVAELYKLMQNVERTHQEIALEVRTERVANSFGQADARAKEKLARNVPIFCSALEFSLDFTKY